MKQRLLVQRARNARTKQISEQTVYDLVYDEHGDEIALKYSSADKKWSKPGKDAATLRNDGNGLHLLLGRGPHDTPVSLYLDYSIADYARVLLSMHSVLYRKKRKDIIIERDRIVRKLGDLDKKPAGRLRPMGEIVGELERVVQEMVGDHDLQWGDVLSLVHGYLRVHNPGAREEYSAGGYPEFYYGPKEE